MLRLTLCAAVALATAGPAFAAPIIFDAAGANPAAIQGSVDAFRAALGANNGNVPGAQAGGRREINWDGGGAAAPATVFPSPFLGFAFRGNITTTPGAGLEISGAPLPEFGEINPTYPDIFQAFSAPRLFAPIGSTVTDALFNVPGDPTLEAAVQAFGVVFTDVDLENVTGIEFFNVLGGGLGTFYAPVADGGLSFLGVIFDQQIARARIITGNTALGPNDGDGVDVVAMDDFIFSEPQQIAAPPAIALLGLGAAALGAVRTRRRV